MGGAEARTSLGHKPLVKLSKDMTPDVWMIASEIIFSIQMTEGRGMARNKSRLAVAEVVIGENNTVLHMLLCVWFQPYIQNCSCWQLIDWVRACVVVTMVHQDIIKVKIPGKDELGHASWQWLIATVVDVALVFSQLALSPEVSRSEKARHRGYKDPNISPAKQRLMTTVAFEDHMYVGASANSIRAIDSTSECRKAITKALSDLLFHRIQFVLKLSDHDWIPASQLPASDRFQKHVYYLEVDDTDSNTINLPVYEAEEPVICGSLMSDIVCPFLYEWCRRSVGTDEATVSGQFLGTSKNRLVLEPGNAAVTADCVLPWISRPKGIDYGTTVK